MNKNKFKFLIVGLVIMSVIGIFSFGVVNASNSLIFISPNSLDKNVGDGFVLVATVDTAGSKVCAVEGKLQLDSELSCQNIVLGEGLMAQKSPSCADPSFLLGIPNCTTVNKTLFTVAVKAEKKGTAEIVFSDVDVIGEGFSLSNTSVGGSYNLTSVAVTPATYEETTFVPEIVPAENCVCEDWSEWQRIDCGAGECESTQLAQTRYRNCEPLNCELTVENRCIADAYCASAIPVEDGSQTASLLDTLGSIGYGWLLGGLILLILIVIITSRSMRKKRK